MFDRGAIVQSGMAALAVVEDLDGTIDEAIYEQITQMFAVEKIFPIGGIILLIAGVIGLALSLTGRSRTPKFVA